MGFVLVSGGPRQFVPRVVSSEGQRQAYVEVVRGYAQGRMLHFNGGIAAMVSAELRFLVVADVTLGTVERVELSQCEQSRQYVDAMRQTVAVLQERSPSQRRSDLEQAFSLQSLWGVPESAMTEVLPRT